MLNSTNLNDKTYEDLKTEALMQIPLLSKEWTNFNPSDPGITIIESLTAFSYLAQTQLNEVSDAVKKKLLSLVGFSQNKGMESKVLLVAKELEEDLIIYPKQRIESGDLVFEVKEETKVPSASLAAIYTGYKTLEHIKDITTFVDFQNSLTVKPFGNHAVAGKALYFICRGTVVPKEKIIFYFKIQNEYGRNAFTNEINDEFAELSWEYYTKQGFLEMKSEDQTAGLLRSGEVRIELGEEMPIDFDELPTKGICIRAVLKKAEYDIVPKAEVIAGFLFEAYQKKTRVILTTYQNTQTWSVEPYKVEQGYFEIYIKDGKQFKKSKEYRVKYKLDGTYLFMLPDIIQEIHMVYYEESMLPFIQLGMIYSYDDQKISLDGLNHVMEEDFLLILEVKQGNETFYSFVSPNETDDEALCYELDTEQNAIHILSQGNYEGAMVYLGNVSEYEGEYGNIRSNNPFIYTTGDHQIHFVNPVDGSGGKFIETQEQVRNRFVNDVKQVQTMVTQSDYEEVVKATPALCIDKVNAIINQEQNQVILVVKPSGSELLPRLSTVYMDQIRKYIDGRRMLTTRILLTQPVYVPIGIQGNISIKHHYENGEKMVYEVAESILDCLKTKKGFGERLRFHVLYREIEKLECVNYIHNLKINPLYSTGAVMDGEDIVLKENALGYLKEFGILFNQR